MGKNIATDFRQIKSLHQIAIYLFLYFLLLLKKGCNVEETFHRANESPTFSIQTLSEQQKILQQPKKLKVRIDSINLHVL